MRNAQRLERERRAALDEVGIFCTVDLESKKEKRVNVSSHMFATCRSKKLSEHWQRTKLAARTTSRHCVRGASLNWQQPYPRAPKRQL